MAAKVVVPIAKSAAQPVSSSPKGARLPAIFSGWVGVPVVQGFCDAVFCAVAQRKICSTWGMGGVLWKSRRRVGVLMELHGLPLWEGLGYRRQVSEALCQSRDACKG